MYASQSNDDNNEGMDVLIPAGWEGDYVAYVARPDGAESCADTPFNERYIFGGYN